MSLNKLENSTDVSTLLMPSVVEGSSGDTSVKFLNLLTFSARLYESIFLSQTYQANRNTKIRLIYCSLTTGQKLCNTAVVHKVLSVHEILRPGGRESNIKRTGGWVRVIPFWYQSGSS